jgi:hypothetical protein
VSAEKEYYEALRFIVKNFQTPTQLKRSCQEDYGLEYEEALELSYENIQAFAKGKLKGKKPPE